MGKKIAICQSNYIPWKGYFDLINLVDEFILYDDAQYTKRDWRNRNKIKSPNGVMWISIPTNVSGRYYQKIKDTMISDPYWNEQHWKSITHNYSRASYFAYYQELFENLFLGSSNSYLSQINYRFLSAICELLCIDTTITWSMDYNLSNEGKTEKLICLCKQAGATEYISGPAAKNYTDEGLFVEEGITLNWMDYSDYPKYTQLWGAFDHYVSILDLIFNMGPAASRYMKSF